MRKKGENHKGLVSHECSPYLALQVLFPLYQRLQNVTTRRSLMCLMPMPAGLSFYSNLCRWITVNPGFSSI
jgi:hypothetical protein